ncbi:hypothetical protein B484DRAFT_411093, partial [Ochromonadaceae sp. CCMP2298]
MVYGLRSTVCGLSSQGQAAAVNQIMADIDFRVFHLKEMFRKGDPLAERAAAAHMIGGLVRGYLGRQRLARFRRGVREWRWTRCRPVTHVLDVLLAQHSKREGALTMLKTNRTMK